MLSLQCLSVLATLRRCFIVYTAQKDRKSLAECELIKSKIKSQIRIQYTTLSITEEDIYFEI